MIKKESLSLEKIKTVEKALADMYSQDSTFHYSLKYYSLAIRYYLEKDRKSLYELTKEERRAFLEWAGEEEGKW